MYNSGDYNFQNREFIRDILLTNGYPVVESGDYINTAAMWRGGMDAKSVVIYYKDNHCIDFVDGSHFDIKKLVSLITNQKTEELDSYFQKRNIVLPPPSPKIKQPKIFSDALIPELLPVYNYWTSRGISETVLKEIGGGVYLGKGIMKNKYVFPILNSKKQIVGLAGRDVTGNNGEYKWVLRGHKANWCYPAIINSSIIKEKRSVWLLESVGDLLSFYECGIKNCLVLFGTELNLAIINYLLKMNVDKIYLSTNDDSKKNSAGNNAAEKAQKRLTKYFSYSQVKIVIPKGGNDWNEILTNLGKDAIIEQLKEYIK